MSAHTGPVTYYGSVYREAVLYTVNCTCHMTVLCCIIRLVYSMHSYQLRPDTEGGGIHLQRMSCIFVSGGELYVCGDNKAKPYRDEVMVGSVEIACMDVK